MTLSTADPLPLLPRARRLAAAGRQPHPAAGWIADVASRVSGVPTPIGSAGMKAMSILLGEADAYLHRGPMKEWDSAAPVVVAAAAGLHTSALDGSALEYNKPDRFTHSAAGLPPVARGRAHRRPRRTPSDSSRRVRRSVPY